MATTFPTDHPSARIAAVLGRIYRWRMTTTSGGNLSIRDENGRIWITPAGKDKARLRPGDIACLEPDGSCRGTQRPSTEHHFHRAIYAARPDLRAIIHAHPPALVAFSIARQWPSTAILPQVFQLCGRVGYTRYVLTGSAELGARIAATFAQGNDCVLLENHGVVVAAANMALAYQRLETLEGTAQLNLAAAALGKVKTLTPRQLRQVEFFAAKTLSPGQRGSRDHRQLSQFLERGCAQRLLTIAGFSMSLRLSHDSFLMNLPPRNSPRNSPRSSPGNTPQNGTAIELQRLSSTDTLPADAASWACRLHQAVYRKHPQIGAIICAAPLHASAFAVTGRPLDTRTIPESYLFLRRVSMVPFAAWADAPALATHVALETPAILLASGGALTVGRTMLEAFDRLEVLESTAEALIKAKALGGFRPMEESRIRELRAAFAHLFERDI